MAAIGRRNGLKMATHLMKTLTGSSRSLSGIVSSEVATSHTQKWMQAVMFKIILELAIDLYTNCMNGQYACRLPSYEEMDTSKKSPMELINEVPPIKVEDRIAVCEGDSNPALGHPVEFICLDKDEPAVCKYCGLRYVQDHHH
ncbi:hypothetical protein SASPL_119091 [Salvia splendens]|uniref:Zinc finger CHCC-type domain-containing protein n=1 Tax=Salvia splendens TaxID=180675 RepID=A0A8X8ZZ03_SALSN|nr:hypothetical protein SASPL_119091 [Salvia splendens]